MPVIEFRNPSGPRAREAKLVLFEGWRGVLAALEKKLLASNFSLRTNSQSVLWNWFVPDLSGGAHNRTGGASDSDAVVICLYFNFLPPHPRRNCNCMPLTPMPRSWTSCYCALYHPAAHRCSATTSATPINGRFEANASHGSREPGEQPERERIAAIQRQIHRFLVVNHLPRDEVEFINERRSSCDLDGMLHAPGHSTAGKLTV
jgi:hypothetical protein